MPTMQSCSVKHSTPAAPTRPDAIDPTVAAITHELRTPLQAILGFTQLARADWPQGVDANYLQQIELATRMMLRSVNDLLDLSHLDRGTLEIDPDQDLDLVALFAELEATARSLVQDKPLVLQVEVDPGCPRYLRGDGRRIQQVMLNLLANALRFTDRGRVTLRATVVARGPQSVRLRLVVADTGVGMDAIDLEKMLAPNDEDGGELISTRRSGAGFGLRIVRKLLQLLGSRLQGVSVPSGGTLLWFELWLPVLDFAPAPEVEASPALQPASPGLPRDPLLHGMRVLVVEDNNLNRVVLCDQLHRLGIAAEVAVNTEEARTRLLSGEFDALISDMQLPDGSGLSLLRWLRQQHGSRAGLPTLFLSAHVGQADQRSAQALGAQACLLKPHDPHALVRHLVAMRRAREAPARVTPRMSAGLEALSGVNLLALFQSEWPALRMAIQRADGVEALRRAVHAARGALAVLGAGSALQRARELEESLLNGQEPEGARADLIHVIDAMASGEGRNP